MWFPGTGKRHYRYLVREEQGGRRSPTIPQRLGLATVIDLIGTE